MGPYILESESHSIVFNSLRPHGLYSPWNSPGQNTGVGSNLFLLQGIFPTQRSNPDLPPCRQILYQLSHQGSPPENLLYLRRLFHKMDIWGQERNPSFCQSLPKQLRQRMCFIFFGHPACGILVFHQGSNLHFLCGKFRVLTSGPPGKSLSSFKKERGSITSYNMDKP